jgi:peptide/nickel transport system substrate-binding protein
MSPGPRVFLALTITFLGAWTAGCASPSSGTQPTNGGTIVLAIVADPHELNCIRANDMPALTICRWVTDTLVDYDHDQNIVPRLAESFESSADGRTLTFHLRKGVRWHDGAPFTATDVLYTVRQIRAPGAHVLNSSLGYLESLVSIEAPDEFTVVTKYREPYALVYQAWADIFILPAHLPFDPGASTPADRHPVGTGPFRFVRWDPQEKIVLEANPEYFLGRPHIDRMIVRYIPDEHTRAIALKSGEIDISDLQISDAAADDTGRPYRIVHYPFRSLQMIVWNVREPKGLFSDSRVRRAMALALDRDAYISRIMNGYALTAVSSFFPGTSAQDHALQPLPHDPKGAAALLAEAGWRDRDGDGVLDTPHGPASFTLLYSPTKPWMEALAALFQADLKPLGVDVHLESLEWNTFLNRINTHSFEAALKAWTLDPDPDPFDLFHSSQWMGGHNLGGYASAEVDRLIEEGRTTMEPGRRSEVYHRLEAILREEQPVMFIAFPNSILGINRQVQGVVTGPSGFLGGYPDILGWWLSPAEARQGR